MEVFSSYQAVQYDKEKGFTTWLSALKKEAVVVSDEVKTLFKDVVPNKNDTEAWLEIGDDIYLNGIDSFIDKHKIADENFKDFLHHIGNAKFDMQDYKQWLIDSGKATFSFSSSMGKAGDILKSLGTSIASIGGNILLGMGIEAAIQGLDYLINYEEKQREAFEKAKATTEETAQSIRDLKSEMSDTSSKATDLSGEFARLVQGVNPLTNKNESLSSEEYERFLEVNNQLAELFPSLTHNYDENGNAILGLGGDVDTVTESIKRLVEQQNTLTKADMRSNLEDYVNGTDDSEGIFNVLENSKKDVQNTERELEDLEQTYDNIINGHGEKIFNRDISYNDYLDDIKNKFGQEAYEAILNIPAKSTGKDTFAIDFSRLQLDEITKDKITKSYNTFSQDLQTDLSVKQSELESKNSEMSEQMMMWVEDLDLYKNGSPTLQKSIEKMVGSIQWSDLNIQEGNLDEAKQFIQSLVLSPLTKACENPDTKLNVMNAFNGLFSLDFSKMNFKEANDKIKEFLSIILKAWNEANPDKPKELSDMYRMFNLENYDQTAVDMDKRNTGIASKGSDDYKKLTDYTKNFTKAQADTWITVTEGAKSADEAIKKYQDHLNADKPKNFDEVWDSLGKSGNKETDNAANEEKERLLELAKAGKLTREELENSFITKEFTEAGVSIEEATKKVNAFVEETKQLSTLRSGITAINSAYSEKRDSENRTVSSSTLDSMGDALGVSDWNEKDLKVWEKYKNVAADGTKGTKELKEAQNALATSFINNGNYLANLTGKNQDYYKGLLQEMGVTNASQIIQQQLILNEDKLTTKKINSKLATLELASATEGEINGLGNELTSIYGSSEALGFYVLRKQLANKDSLKTADSIANLIALAKQCGITGEAIDLMTSMEANMEQVEYYTKGKGKNDPHAGEIISNAKSDIKGAEKRLKKLANKKYKVKLSEINIGNEGKTRTTSNNNDSRSTNQKETKQTIDWIERRLSNLQRVIDLTAAKFQNIFKIEKQKSNLDKQIKTTKQLIKEYGLAAEKYQKKANKVAAGTKVKGKRGKKKVKNKLSKGIIKKIKTGKLTKKTKTSSLIKAYGSEKAEQIQSYIDYNDKAQSAKKSKVEQITKQRELEQQKLQLDVDLYNERISRAEAKEAVAIGAKKKNASVNKQIKNIQLSYDKQIAIAELTKGAKSKAEIDRLKYEKKKKITDLKVHQIDNIKKDYENKISPIDNAKQKTQNEVSLLEAKGHIVTANYYRKQNDQEINKRNTLQNELKELQGKLKSGTFTEYSDEWYQLQSDIQSVENSINECNVNIVENSKKLGELHNAMLEDIAANNTRMSSEADFLAGLMGSVLTDENGNGLTKEGMGVLGTYGIGLETAEKNAEDSAKERVRLEKLLSSGSYGRTNDEYQSEKSLRDKIAEVAQKQQEYTKTAYDYETKIADLMKENYQAQLDYMKKIIDAKKNVLSLEKDLYDYERNISDQTKNIAALEKQYAALQGDDSEEGRAKRSSLQASIDEARQELQDTEYDKYISDQQNMLDNLYTEYEDLMNNLFKDQNQLLEEGIKVINEKGTTIKGVIDSYADSYGYNYTKDFSSVITALGSEGTIVTSMRGAINGDDSSAISQVLKAQADRIIEAYGEPKTPPTSVPTDEQDTYALNQKEAAKHKNNSDTTGKTFKLGSNGNSSVATKSVYSTLTTGGTDANLAYGVNQFIRLHGKKPAKGHTYKPLNKAIKKEFGVVLTTENLKKLAKKVGVKFDGSEKSDNLYKKLKAIGVQGFKHGGIAKLVKSQGEDGLAMVRNGEGLISPENVAELQKFVKVIPTATDLLNNMKNIPIMPNLPTPSNTFGDIHFDKIELPNVQDVDDFVTALQTDKKVQRALGVSVHDLMTKGRITSNIQKL